jgi:hypothetical protein
MSDGFNKLKELGAQKIHENTHIAKEHVQAILHNSFDGMNKIQFLGFVAILERDYNVELSELKIKGLEYFLNVEPEPEKSDKVFLEKNKTSFTPYIFAILVVVVVVAFFVLNKSFSNEAQIKLEKIDDSAIENAQTNLLQNSKKIVELNSSVQEKEDLTIVDKPKSKVVVKIDSKIKEKKLSDNEPSVIEPKGSLKVIPHTKLWMGYTDLKQNKKYQKLFTDELSLNPNTDWLLNLGHGNVSFELNGKTIDYNSIKNMKFLYTDGNLTEITYKKFINIKTEHKW